MSHPLIIIYLVSPCVYEEGKNKTKQNKGYKLSLLIVIYLIYYINPMHLQLLETLLAVSLCIYLAAESVQPFFRLKEFGLVWIPIT